MSENTVQRRRFVPKSYSQRYGSAMRVELAAERHMRTRNKLPYRWAHWPLWIFVFFIAPGPLMASMLAGHAGGWPIAWFCAALAGTGVAFVRGKLPGVEPAPYILRFGDDMPNPLYRRVCYTFAWSVILSFPFINIVALAHAIITERWQMIQVYTVLYLPVAGSIWALGVLGTLPRARRSTKHEGIDRRYFYGSLWTVTIAQTGLLVLWQTLPKTQGADITKLVIFVSLLTVVGLLARFGLLPRTRPILPGTVGRAD